MNTCFSGGAKGADIEWGNYAAKYGHDVVHFLFQGCRTNAPLRQRLYLTPDQLLEADTKLIKAAPKLKKYYTPFRDPRLESSSTPNLLRRNWWQVKDSERVYAVTTIKDGIVQGGTAWAVQMFLDRHNCNTCECYVYDQQTMDWWQWTFHQDQNRGWWQAIGQPPKPHGRWTGIGTRDLNPAGKSAIYDLFHK